MILGKVSARRDDDGILEAHDEGAQAVHIDARENNNNVLCSGTDNHSNISSWQTQDDPVHGSTDNNNNSSNSNSEGSWHPQGKRKRKAATYIEETCKSIKEKLSKLDLEEKEKDKFHHFGMYLVGVLRDLPSEKAAAMLKETKRLITEFL